ncbi:MAG: dihydrofolate reductase [Pseudomonadota bacterium]
MQQEPKLCLIVARGRNGVIGREGDLPWRLRDDLALFKKTTGKAPILMGRKTWESLPKQPLPGRQNLVLSRNWTFQAKGARVYSNLAAATAVARAMANRAGLEEFFVIGGAGLYRDALPLADRLYITEVDAAPDGDVSFPDFDAADWHETERQEFEHNDANDHAFVFRKLDRIGR